MRQKGLGILGPPGQDKKTPVSIPPYVKLLGYAIGHFWGDLDSVVLVVAVVVVAIRVVMMAVTMAVVLSVVAVEMLKGSQGW